MRGLLLATVLASLGACGADRVPGPSILDPTITELELRRALGVPDGARRVLVLGQTSHLDIDWRVTFDEYYEDHVKGVFDQALAMLDADSGSAYAIAEMAFLAEHLGRDGDAAWRRHAATGRLRIVGGAMTTPDTLLATAEPLVRDYLAGSLVAEQHLGVQPRAAWLPDSFGHAPTVPDVLAAAGFESVGFGRVDGARHTYEVTIGGLEPIVPGVTTTASLLRDLGAADFVWRGPGGGEVLAHYMPVREYCQGDTIDLDGYAIAGQRLGVDHDQDPAFVRARIAEYLAELTPYQRTPYLFVPVGCDFQPPRPRLTTYARWWNDARYAETGVWVVVATFDDYMKLVGFHREALPVLERDIAPVWTGFYASRPRVKRAARVAADTLTGVEPFLALAAPGSDALAPAWESVVLANHHDWITGTAADRVVDDEQLPRLADAQRIADAAWQRVLDELPRRIDTRLAEPGQAVVVLNPGPVDRGGVVEVETAKGPMVFFADRVPALGWRTFTLDGGAAPRVTASLDADRATLDTGVLHAELARDAAGWTLRSLVVAGEELLAGASLELVVYADTGGLYRIGSERPDCTGDTYAELATVRVATLTLIEAGPARAIVRGTATVEGQPVIVDFLAEASGERLGVRITGAAGRERTVAMRVRPAAPDDHLRMGVVAGVVRRPLAHHYRPSLWPATTWVARGGLAVHLGQATAVRGSADGALEWVVFRNAVSEQSCDNLGPAGFEDSVVTVDVSIGRPDRATGGAADLAASMALTRPLRAVTVERHAGTLPGEGRLIAIEGGPAIVTALKSASRGDGFVLHLERFGEGAPRVVIRPGLLPWRSMTRPDLLERNDVPIGEAVGDGVAVTLDDALVALRLAP